MPGATAGVVARPVPVPVPGAAGGRPVGGSPCWRRGELAERTTALWPSGVRSRAPSRPTALTACAGWNRGPVRKPCCRTVSRRCRAALAAGPRWLLTASPAGVPRVDGLRGLFRTRGPRVPGRRGAAGRVRAGHAPGRGRRRAAGTPVPRRSCCTGRTARAAWTWSPPNSGLLGSSGAGPAGDGAAEAAAIGLDRDSVVLLVGGGAGITARFAGRTRRGGPLPARTGRTDAAAGLRRGPGHRTATTPAELRAALLAAGVQGARRDRADRRRGPGAPRGRRDAGRTARRSAAPRATTRSTCATREAVHRAGQGDPRRARPARRRRLRGRGDRGQADRRQGRRRRSAGCSTPRWTARGRCWRRRRTCRARPVSPCCSAASPRRWATAASPTTPRPTTRWKSWAGAGRRRRARR